MNIVEIYERFPTEDDCREFFKNVRWPDGVKCPKCGHNRTSELKSRKQFTCLKCRHRFSVTSGTVMHSTKLPMRKWLLAIYMLSDAKKSVPALQISRQLKISVKRAWHPCHRIREAMAEDPAQAELFAGIVQADDTYIGGKARPEDKGKLKRGRGNERKQPIVGAVESSSGKVRTAVVPDYSADSLESALERFIDAKRAELHTDQWSGYERFGRRCTHKTVNHDEWYVAEDGTHCNAVESAWSLFKRAIVGSFHHVSRKHLHRYLAEFDSRFNARHDDNGDYVHQIVGQADGRQLRMKDLVA